MHPIIKLSEMYPQILFPIERGIHNTKEYRNVCLRGFKSDRKPDFSFSDKDVYRATGGKINLSDEEWIEKSITIRKFHELRHFEDRKLRPDDIDVLRDEILADRDGLISAFGNYDKNLAKLFLGIEGEEYREGGRLANYLPDGVTLSDFIKQDRVLIK